MNFTKFQSYFLDHKKAWKILMPFLVWGSKVLVVGSQSVLRGFRAIRDQFARESVETLL
jgi:hypothetical protein